MAQAPEPAGDTSIPQGGDLVRRHTLATRLWHWTNALTILVMLMSGLMILNAHPRLYWGHYGSDHDEAWLVLAAMEDTAFPGWMTIPSDYSLADARLWHLAFAWLLVLAFTAYLIWGLVRGHIRRRLHITRAEWSPRHILHDIGEHARLRFPTGAAALDYNVLQKLAYGGVLFVLIPAIILSGLAMAPALDAAWPWLVDLFGGRQSARSIHFIAAMGLVLFFVAHIVMVVLAGPINEVRSMLTGCYRLPRAKGEEA
jgi:thiosulfate reductase cytochrome b subunit